jgi:hypothetical protein
MPLHGHFNLWGEVTLSLVQPQELLDIPQLQGLFCFTVALIIALPATQQKLISSQMKSSQRMSAQLQW